MTKPMPDYLTTREVADLIRLKERKVYDLVATGAIPCVRVTGKLLFPRNLVEGAHRQQGLIVPPGNPLKLGGIADLAGRRVIGRQREAGAFVLLERLLGEAGLGAGDLEFAEVPALTEADVAVAVGEGRADAGLGIATAAHQARLGFVPLVEERYDIAVWRAA